ncbi:GRB2-associated-binding protein 2 [Varanus komodoensis]|nr:GRB2-associated-binding protein 2 [Varanus komodoensis]
MTRALCRSPEALGDALFVFQGLRSEQQGSCSLAAFWLVHPEVVRGLFISFFSSPEDSRVLGLSSSAGDSDPDVWAWKKRWFILRSGRMSGDPDVLEYYKNDHSKKPLRVINLNFCEQVDAGLTFNKKELQDSYVFDIKTSERTFYLVAETEDDMNKWVRSICQICGFNQSEENAGTGDASWLACASRETRAFVVGEQKQHIRSLQARAKGACCTQKLRFWNVSYGVKVDEIG